eukprot:7932248-Karenia_brevis.AAC.1
MAGAHNIQMVSALGSSTVLELHCIARRWLQMHPSRGQNVDCFKWATAQEVKKDCEDSPAVNMFLNIFDFDFYALEERIEILSCAAPFGSIAHFATHLEEGRIFLWSAPAEFVCGEVPPEHSFAKPSFHRRLLPYLAYSSKSALVLGTAFQPSPFVQTWPELHI